MNQGNVKQSGPGMTLQGMARAIDEHMTWRDRVLAEFDARGRAQAETAALAVLRGDPAEMAGFHPDFISVVHMLRGGWGDTIGLDLNDRRSARRKAQTYIDTLGKKRKVRR